MLNQKMHCLIILTIRVICHVIINYNFTNLTYHIGLFDTNSTKDEKEESNELTCTR